MSGAGSFLSGLAGGYMTGAKIDGMKSTPKTDQSPGAWGALGRGIIDPEKGSPVSKSGRVDAGFDPAQFDQQYVDLLQETASALQLPVEDVATQISYETAGTFDPMRRGPTTQWGRHQGLIQFGKPQAEEYGADFTDRDTAISSQLGKDGAIVKYALSSGFVPGQHGALDLYSTINAGAPGRYGASDANNGGAPGTVRDKYENQMGGHRAKAQALLEYWAPKQGGEAKSPPQSIDRGVLPLNASGEAILDRFYRKKEAS